MRQEILRMHHTLNLLYAPRKREACSEIPEETTRRSVVHLVRKLKAKDEESAKAMRTLLDHYAVRCILVEGCT